MTFEVKFASSEKEFILHDYVNKGYYYVTRKVVKCYFLSDGAKMLYTSLLSFAFEDKRDCFPGQATLRAELRWSRKKLNSCLDELRDKGFVTTHRRVGKPLLYRIEEIHTIPCLVHSELVHNLKSHYRDRLEDFYDAVDNYEDSSLYETISNSPNPIDFIKDLEVWFEDFLNSPDLKVNEEVVEPDTPTHVSSVTGMRFALPVAIKDRGQTVPSPDEPKKKSKKVKEEKNNPYLIPVEEWGVSLFCTYFEQEIYRLTGVAYLITKADIGSISRLMGERDTEEGRNTTKLLLDAYLSLDFFKHKSLAVFTAHKVQRILEQYLNSGSLPSYLTNEGKSNSFKANDQEWLDELNKL